MKEVMKKKNKLKRSKKMGDVKNNMSTTTPAKKTGDKVFGIFERRTPRKDQDDQTTAQTFADMINLADKRLAELVAKKEVELKTEGTSAEEYNRKALALLKTMQHHLDEVINTAADYGEIKH